MATVPEGVETLPKISIAWAGRTNVTYDRQTTDGRTIIANVNSRSRSLIKLRQKQTTAIIKSKTKTVLEKNTKMKNLDESNAVLEGGWITARLKMN